jgi:polyhydroxybutyrate depolymerase
MKTMYHTPTIFVFAILLVSVACGQLAAKPTAISPTATPAATLTPGDSTHTLTVGDLERTYLLHIPSGLDSQTPLPVVFVFHGFSQTGEIIQIMSGFNQTADQNSFVLIYPNGVDQSWNGSGCCGTAVNKDIDDLAFVRQILSDLGTILMVDPKRIYATGFSNGAMFSYRLACEMSDTFAAIAPVSGWLLTDPCQPQQPVSVMHVHGSIDDYGGSTAPMLVNGVSVEVIFPAVEQGIATWAQLDGCTGTAQVETQGAITHHVYTACKAGSSVELFTLDGGSHAWPNMYAFPSISSPGIWDFFKAHPKR